MSKRRRVANTSSKPSRSPRPAWTIVAGLLLVACAAAIAFGNSIFAPFLLDDHVAILDNVSLRHVWPLGRALVAERESPLAGRPLVNLSFALNYAASGFDPAAYHATNVALHVACALLLWGVVYRTCLLPRLRDTMGASASWVATTSALLWAVHPLNSEAVDYTTQRTELMMAVAYFLTLYSSIRAAGFERPSRWSLFAILACSAGMMCKESMVTAPVMVALYDRTYVYGAFRTAIITRWRLYAGLAASWAVLAALSWSGPRMRSAGFSSGIAPWTYLLNQPSMILRYLRLAVWPRGLVVAYGYPRPLVLHDVWLASLCLTGMLACTVLLYRRRPQLGFLPLWVFVTLAPTSSLVPIATEVGAERRMYLPLAALAVGVALFVAWIARHSVATTSSLPQSRRRTVVSSVLIASCSLLLITASRARGREYQSSLALTTTLVERWPTGHSHALFAIDLIAAGRHDEGTRHLRQALAEEPRASYVLGVELFNRHEWDAANDQLRAFVRDAPLRIEVVDARVLMGRIAAVKGRLSEAEADYRQAVQMNPRHPSAQFELADVLSQQQRFDEAIREYESYLHVRPSDEQATVRLGVVLQRAGREDAALKTFQAALALNPADPDANRNVAALFLNRQAARDALSYARRAVEAAPADGPSHDVLGAALLLESRADEAFAEFTQALRLNPNDAFAAEQRQVALQEQRRLQPARAR